MVQIVKHLVRPEHLNGTNRLFGGTLLSWIDEATAIAAIELVGSTNVATVAISDIVFKRPVQRGELIRIAVCLTEVGRTSLTFRVMVTGRRRKDPVCPLRFPNAEYSRPLNRTKMTGLSRWAAIMSCTPE